MTPQLAVLSFGGGQDSTALLYRYHRDPVFRERYAPADFVVVCADTGDEHPPTLDHLEWTRRYCRSEETAFHWLRAGGAYSSNGWAGLRQFYRHKSTIGSKAFPKSCTDQLKIRPLYRWLNEWVGERYGYPPELAQARGKQCLLRFHAEHGRIRMLLGIAAGEEKRVQKINDGLPLWFQKTIERCYPLIELGLDRAGCQAYIRETGLPLPPPSNCMLCPYLSPIELLYLARVYPLDYQEWVGLEAAKIAANRHQGERNLGVFGRKLLPQVLAEAEVKFGHLTDTELAEYKMSHGHCVKSAY